MDPLSDAFNALEGKNVLYGRFELGAPWGFRMPPGHCNFGMVVRGQCWLETEKEEVSLAAGDCFLLPRGMGYGLRDDPKTAHGDFEGIKSQLATGRYGGNGRTTSMISGCFTFDASFTKPMFDLLPSVILVKADDPHAATLQTTIRQLASEMQGDAPGAEVVINRLVDVFFLQAIRFYMSHCEGCSSAWLRAVRDPQIGRVLVAIHGNLGHIWTVEELAVAGGMSRAAFALRFKQLLGETPLEYLTRWRMYKAKRLMRDPNIKLLQVANQVGYDSDGAFNRAFKRLHGFSAGEYRRSFRPSAESGR